MSLCKRIALGLALLSFGGGCTIGSAPSDLRRIDRSSAPNDALACPPAACKAEPDVESPLFDVQAERLGDIARRVIAAQARTELADEDPDLSQMVFVQRSKLFGFPDTVRVQTVDLESQASIIIYSRSNFGYWDLGANLRRVRSWLAEVESAVRAETGQPR